MEAGKLRIWGQGLTEVMSGGRVSDDWDPPVLILIPRTHSARARDQQLPVPGSVVASGEIFTEGNRERAGAGQAEPGHCLAARGDRGLRTKKWLCSALSSAGCRAPLCRRGRCRAYKTSKNPGQVFTCEAAKPRQGPSSLLERSPWPDPGPTYITNDFPWISVKWFYLCSIFTFIIGTEHERSLFLEATWDLIRTRYYLYREYPGS